MEAMLQFWQEWIMAVFNLTVFDEKNILTFFKKDWEQVVYPKPQI